MLRPFPSIPTQNHSKENREIRKRGMNFICDETRIIGYPASQFMRKGWQSQGKSNRNVKRLRKDASAANVRQRWWDKM